MPRSRPSLAGDECVPVLCTHRPSLLAIGCRAEQRRLTPGGCEVPASRASKSRNKVTVGEPAVGSFVAVAAGTASYGVQLRTEHHVGGNVALILNPRSTYARLARFKRRKSGTPYQCVNASYILSAALFDGRVGLLVIEPSAALFDGRVGLLVIKSTPRVALMHRPTATLTDPDVVGRRGVTVKIDRPRGEP